ncbi:MAG: hypothetical protein IJT77_06695 [Clostridia bacterium]|nr:hypothetical protein [Clostridia bacterium]
MAAAAQQQKPQTNQNSGKAAGAKAPAKKPLPQAVGIGIMVVLLVASLFVGNMRALQKVTPPSFMKQGDVASIVEDRVNAAVNAETVSKRASVDSSLYTAVDSAVSAFKSAKNARDLSRADQNLTTAVSEMTAAANRVLSTEDQRVLSKARDNFDEQGNFLRQEARSFNTKAEKARDLYEKLPTSFILPQPDYYEGL